MKNLKYAFPIIILLIATISVFSCKNDKEETEAENHATISIYAPTEGAVFAKGDTVKVDAKGVGELELHGWQVQIKKKASGEVVFEDDAHEHGDSLHIVKQWINNVTEHTDMQLIFSVALDHEGHLASDTVSFHCHPM